MEQTRKTGRRKEERKTRDETSKKGGLKKKGRQNFVVKMSTEFLIFF